MRDLTASIIASALLAAAVLLTNYWVLVRAGDAVKSLMQPKRPFHDGRVDEEVQALVQKADYLKRALQWSEYALQIANDKLRTGEFTQIDVDKAQVDVLHAGSAHIDAKIAAEHAPKKHRDMIDKLDATKQSLRQHQTFLQIMKSAMTIPSPVQGEFRVLVASGSFVRRGHVLGEITI
jgi:hypothetical protein